jgi:uncharacterized damage-inducible protein DinB
MDKETGELKDTLDSQRNHVLGILEGMSEEQLRRPVLPSGWTCLGMVKHLALADEHYWFRCIMGGESTGYFPQGPNAEWQLAPGESAEDVFRLYRDEIERSDEIIAATGIDAKPRQLDPRWGEWGQRFTSLRVVMLHMIVETANHAGHLDAAAELIDGRQWVVMRD